MSDQQLCGAEAEHPEYGTITCQHEPHGPDTAHKWKITDTDEAIEWSDEDAHAGAGPAFDLEAFVKALPEGVALCPMCLGMGGVVEDPPFDPHTYRCPTCIGLGTTRTGSRRTDENAQHECADCDGKGYKHRGDAPPATPARAADFTGDVSPTDHMGRTPDDPDFDWTRVVRDIEPAPVTEPV